MGQEKYVIQRVEVGDKVQFSSAGKPFSIPPTLSELADLGRDYTVASVEEHTYSRGDRCHKAGFASYDEDWGMDIMFHHCPKDCGSSVSEAQLVTLEEFPGIPFSSEYLGLDCETVSV